MAVPGHTRVRVEQRGGVGFLASEAEKPVGISTDNGGAVWRSSDMSGTKAAKAAVQL